MKRIFLIILISASTLVVTAQQKLKLSLDDAIGVALKNNFGQQILEVSHQSAGSDLAQSKRDLLPDVNASISHSLTDNNNSGSYGVNASAVLWKGGQGMNAIRRNQLLLQQADTKIAQSQNELTISVIKAFLTVLMNDELYRYQAEVAKISKQQMEQGKVKHRSGQILESDYMLLSSQYANDQYNLTNSKINRDNAILELKTLLSADTLTDLEVVAPLVGINPETIDIPSLQQLLDETMAWLPDLKIAEQNIEIAQSNIKIAKGAFFPTVSLGGSASSGYNSSVVSGWGKQFNNNIGAQLGLSISIPLWNKGNSRYQVQKNQYSLRQSELEAQQTQLTVRSNLEKEYRSVIALKEKFMASKTSSQAYEQTFKVFSVQYEAGSINTTELLQQQNNYLSALNDFLQSKYSFLLNRKILDVYMGKEIKI